MSEFTSDILQLRELTSELDKFLVADGKTLARKYPDSRFIRERAAAIRVGPFVLMDFFEELLVVFRSDGSDGYNKDFTRFRFERLQDKLGPGDGGFLALVKKNQGLFFKFLEDVAAGLSPVAELNPCGVTSFCSRLGIAPRFVMVKLIAATEAESLVDLCTRCRCVRGSLVSGSSACIDPEFLFAFWNPREEVTAKADRLFGLLVAVLQRTRDNQRYFNPVLVLKFAKSLVDKGANPEKFAQVAGMCTPFMKFWAEHAPWAPISAIDVFTSHFSTATYPLPLLIPDNRASGASSRRLKQDTRLVAAGFFSST